jgi:hypothetical protein
MMKYSPDKQFIEFSNGTYNLETKTFIEGRHLNRQYLNFYKPYEEQDDELKNNMWLYLKQIIQNEEKY